MSIDGGESWALVARPPTWEQTETSTMLSIGQGFIVDPTSTQRVIAIGTDFSSTGPSVQSTYVTEDGGQTWNELPPPPFSVDLSSGFADAGGMLYLSAEGHLLRSSDWEKTWTDAGLRDSHHRCKPASVRRQADLLPSGVALLATRNVSEPGFEASAVFLGSVDSGHTWLEMKGLELLPSVHFFASYAKPAVVFAVGAVGRLVFRSDDDGSTWRQASPPPDENTAGQYDDPAALIIWEIVDHAGGGILASTSQGLVHFE